MAGRAGDEGFSAETAVANVPEDVGLSGGTQMREWGISPLLSRDFLGADAGNNSFLWHLLKKMLCVLRVQLDYGYALHGHCFQREDRLPGRRGDRINHRPGGHWRVERPACPGTKTDFAAAG